MVAARKSPQSIALRAKVILKSAEHPDWTDTQVAESVGCSTALVRKWRKRWSQIRSLKEAPRSGRPRTFLLIVRELRHRHCLQQAGGLQYASSMLEL